MDKRAQTHSETFFFTSLMFSFIQAHRGKHILAVSLIARET